jgi:hypothetical protein
LLTQLEQLWQIPAILCARGSRWANLWWALQGLRFRRGAVRIYAGEYAGSAVRVVTAGRTKHALRFCEDVLGALELTRDGGRVSLSRPIELDALPGDLIVAEIHPRHAAAFRDAGWILVPGWIRWRADLRERSAKLPRSVKSDLNKADAHGYEYARSLDRGDWDDFWRAMVEPYVLERFAEWAWVPPRIFRRVFERFGVLHFVYQGGRRVAGFAALCSRERGWFPVLGVLPEPELRRQGVVAAIYKFTFEWARARGLRYVDLGRSEAFLNDGVGQYKQKWGLEPVADPMGHLLCMKVGPAVEAAFREEPVRALTRTGFASFIAP